MSGEPVIPHEDPNQPACVMHADSTLDVSLNVDGKRRLVLVRRDKVEHLILLGATSELVIENNITPPENSFSKAIHDATQTTETQSQLIIRKEKVPQGPPLPKNLLNNPKNDKQNSDSEKKT